MRRDEVELINGDGKVLVSKEVLDDLFDLDERIRMKIRQLESVGAYDDFGGIGVGEGPTVQHSYIKALRWAIQTEYGEV